jgi:hypothetical protein
MESSMQEYLVEASMTWAKLVQVFGGLPPQRKSNSSEWLFRKFADSAEELLNTNGND